MLKFEPSGFGFFMHKFMLPKKGTFIIKFYDKYKNIVAFKNGKGYNESMKIGIYANLIYSGTSAAKLPADCTKN